MLYNGKKWTINRKYRAFYELHKQLVEEFPHVEFPDTSIQFSKIPCEAINMKRTGSIEEKRDQLQKYIRDLTLIPSIRESIIFKEFIGLDELQNKQRSNYYLTKSQDNI